MSPPGIGELLVILAIVALLFGTKKLRNIGGDLGSAIKSFRNSMKDDDSSTSAPKTGNVIEGDSSPKPGSDNHNA